MTQTSIRTLHSSQLNTKSFRQDDFVEDVCALFTGKNQGHMERWEYGFAIYQDDPSNGSSFWANFIKSPELYYLTDGEKKLIRIITQNETPNILKEIRTVIELGPGCNVSIAEKTIPFINACPNLDSYLAVDSEITQAQMALERIGSKTKIRRLDALHQDFDKITLNFPRLGPTALIMWGCTFGNIAGAIGQNPYSLSLKKLNHYNEIITSGDYIFITFDTQDNESAVLNAYNQPLLSACFLSTLHRLVRDNLVTGNFDPYQWNHESIWVPETMQCAHTLYPLADQNFVINGVEISIPRHKRLVTNNSYKFKPEVMISAAKEAGFSPQVVQHGPMAMLIAEKI